MGKAVDRLVAATYVKQKVDEAYKQAEADAECELSEFAEKGASGITSTYTPGKGGDPILLGEYKYSQTRAKKVIEYNVCGLGGLPEWIAANAEDVAAWLATPIGRSGETFAQRFAAWHFDRTGEVPDGISRTERDEPARRGAPKLYRFDADEVGRYFESHGGWLEGAGRLMLGDGDA